MNQPNRIIVKVDASVFNKKPGDVVQVGEFLGHYGGRSIEAPFHGTIEIVSFDADSHSLLVSLVETAQPARTVLQVDASAFDHKPGDFVGEGEQLGRCAGKDVAAPFPARVHCVAFDADSHSLFVTIVETSEPVRTTVRVHASVFEKNPGDAVSKGEKLGHYAGDDIAAPFDGTVESVTFDPDSHVLLVGLIKKRAE